MREASGEITLHDIPANVLEVVIKYFHHKVRENMVMQWRKSFDGASCIGWAHCWQVKYTNSRAPPPDFDIKPEMALEVLMAANFLECVS